MGLFEGKPYEVIEIVLKEKTLGTSLGNINEIEDTLNKMLKKGYRLHTMNIVGVDSKGIAGGDRAVAILVFEKIGLLDN